MNKTDQMNQINPHPSRAAILRRTGFPPSTECAILNLAISGRTFMAKALAVKTPRKALAKQAPLPAEVSLSKMKDFLKRKAQIIGTIRKVAH